MTKKKPGAADPEAIAIVMELRSAMQSGHADDVAAYVAEGREFEALPDRALEAAWIAAFRLSPVDLESVRKGRRLHMEMEIRGLQPPYLKVVDTIGQLLKAEISVLRDADPEVLSEAVVEAIEAHIEEYQKNKGPGRAH